MKTLVVGFGIAGVSIAYQLKKNKIPFHVIDSSNNSSSLLAGGVFNPTILKRYTMSWEGKDFSDYAVPFYKEISSLLNSKIFNQIAINRIFSSVSDQNRWYEASDKNQLDSYFKKDIVLKTDKKLNTPYGFGQLKNVGQINFKLIINKFKKYLNDSFKNEMFDYSELIFFKDRIKYRNVFYRNIIFCEGYNMKTNPYFNYLPLTGNKGEMLIIKSSKLSNKIIIKGKFFIVPLKHDLFWVGATFNNIDKTTNKTESAKNELLGELQSKLNIQYEVVSHDAQIRPTVKDRRPLLGQHPEINNLYVFNGLGTRGSLMAPRLSNFLFNYIFFKKALPTSIDIRRFTIEK